jgi:hypothetical protein
VAKPDLSLYVGKKVIAIVRGEKDWEWGVKLQGDVEIRNKDRRESFRPMKIVNYYFSAMSLSTRDTTLHFAGPGNDKQVVSFTPTKYVIFDPKYEGEVWPQWDEYLESMGIPSMEGEEISAEAGEQWPDEEARLRQEREQRIQAGATNFLREDGEDVVVPPGGSEEPPAATEEPGQAESG